MKSGYNSKLSGEIEAMRDSIVDINSQYTQQQLEVYGYNPNKHWTILHQYEDAAGKVPIGITEILKNRSLLKEERRLAKELKPYNNFVFSYRESGRLPTENIGKEPVNQAQSNNILTDCYNLLKTLPGVIKENPKDSTVVAGVVVAGSLLSTGPLADCVSDGGYEMQKYFDNLELPELVGVASASPADDINWPGDETDHFDDTNHFFSFASPSELYDNCRGFDREYKLQEELIKTPDEITEDLKAAIKYTHVSKGGFGDLVIDNQLVHFDRISGSDLDLGVWLASSSSDHQDISPYMIGLDIDGDGKIETLAPMCYQYKGSEDITPIKNHALKVPKILYDNYGNKIEFADLHPAYVINPFSVPENPEDFSSAEILAYWKNTDGIRVTDKVIYHSDIIGKTPRMLGLDKIDNPNEVYYQDDYDLHGDDDNWGYPEWFDGVESDGDDDNTLNFIKNAKYLGTLERINGFGEAPLDLDKPIPTPDKINLFIMNNMYETKSLLKEDYQDDGILEKGKIHLPETYLTIWGASYNNHHMKHVQPDLVYLDTDGDGEPEQLGLVKLTTHRTEDNPLTKILEGHFRFAYQSEEINCRKEVIGSMQNYLINLQETQPEFEKLKRELPTEETSHIQYASHLYIDNPEKVIILGAEDGYPPVSFRDFYSFNNKSDITPRELGLTEDNSNESIVLKKPLDEFNINGDYSKLIPGYVEIGPKREKDKFPLAGILPDGIGALEVVAGAGVVLAGAGAARLLVGKKSGPTGV